MKRKIIVVATLCLLLMLVIPRTSATETNDEVELQIYSGQRGGNIGIGVSYEVTNHREDPVNVTFIFYPVCFRPWSQMDIHREIQPQDTVTDTFYFPIFSIGVVFTQISESDSSNYIERIGYHIGQLVFLNPVM